MARRDSTQYVALLAAGLVGFTLFSIVRERCRRRIQEDAGSASPALKGETKSSPVKLVILFSGKRKSGKDYVTDRLLEAFNKHNGRTTDRSGKCCTAEIGRLSAPLKRAYAEEHGLDYQELLSDGPYKEKYRASMVKWGEEKRKADPGFFARLVVGAAKAEILIISDARRATDLEFFRQPAAFGYGEASEGCPWKLLTVRVECSVEERNQRGFRYDPAVDAAESECGLDTVANWDAYLRNEGAAACPAPMDNNSDSGGGKGTSGGKTRLISFNTTPDRPGGVSEQVNAIAEHAASML